MFQFNKKTDSLTRRVFVSGAAKSMLGVGTLPLLSQLASADEKSEAITKQRAATAKSVIYVYLSGGMSHLDTFDTKPGAKTQGPVESIKTSADNVRISEYFPKLAHQMHNVAAVNSMTSTQGAHEQGRYFMHTSYFLRGTITHPDMGGWSSFHLGKRNKTLPANIKIGGNSNGLGGGFLEAEHGALPIGDPNSGLQNSVLPPGVTPEQFARRLSRAQAMNDQFVKSYNVKSARAYAGMYNEAVKLMDSKDLLAFDISKEKSEMHQLYGENKLGQACLLARRLVENGVRFVEVTDGGWDTHNDNFNSVQTKGAVLDQALAGLLGDLESRGMLKDTLVVLATEFGRTPTIVEARNGRNHYPKAFSCLLAGGGIKGGLKYGKTDAEGREVEEDMVTIPDFNATIAASLGLPLKEKVFSPSRRPFTVADDGEVVEDLFA